MPFLGYNQSVFNKAFDESNTANHTANALEYLDQYYFTQKVFIGGAAVFQAVCLDSNGSIIKKEPIVIDSVKNIFYGYSGSLQRLTTNEFCQLYKTGGDSILQLVFFDDSLEVTRTVAYAVNLFTGPCIVKQANDSTLLLLGQVSNPNYWDLVLINTDLQGNERWRTVFGEPGKDDYGYTIEVIQNEIYVGSQVYYDNVIAHPQIVKLNFGGQVIFDTTFLDIDNGGSFVYHEQYGFYLYGSRNNFPTSLYPVISKLDSNLEIVWSKEYFKNAQLVNTGSMTISDMGIITMAGSQVFGNSNSGVFFQIDQFGDSIGSKILEHSPGAKSSFDGIRPTSDGGYIMAGQTNAPTQDSWIVKVNGWGCDNIPCIVNVDEAEEQTGSLNCFPNPTRSSGTISGSLPFFNPSTQVSVFNALGQLVYTFPVTQREFTFVVDFLVQGMYLVVVSDGEGIIQQQKWVVR